MTRIVLLLVILQITGCKKPVDLPVAKDNVTGVGLLYPNLSGGLAFYTHENATVPFDILSIKKRKEGGYNFESEMPEGFMHPYMQYGGNTDDEAQYNVNSGLEAVGFTLQFKVLKITSTGYYLLYNEKTGTTAFIRKVPASRKAEATNEQLNNVNDHYVELWEDYLKRVEYITSKNEIVLYDAPGGSETYRKKTGERFMPFRIIDVKGDWAKIEPLKEAYSDSYDPEVNYRQWLRWKDSQKITIEITEHSIE